MSKRRGRYDKTYRAGANKFVTNGAGYEELMKSAAMTQECHAIAERVARNAGDGYEVEDYKGLTRNHSVVKPNTVVAHRSNLKHNTLLKALR